ncbi:hypothetical protein B0J12DRAFT_277987 [Macrophomina phaseolina]|uniref:Fungal N-terminal domain-containing protein n=1 Tax=Macrophomina phaseolina TaxID=35725 RepID=A0ABQ8FXF4_9PEZI|nr:hypothetical protein B0J12DRAFT_277987 [Macrophomina phaseolina]
MHYSKLEAAIALLTNASRAELESHSHSIKSLLDKLRALPCVQSTRSTEPENVRPRDTLAHDLQIASTRVKGLFDLVREKQESILEFLKKQPGEAFQGSLGEESEDVRITDIRNASNQPVERKFRKVLAARSLGKEYGNWQFCHNGNKTSFCNDLGEDIHRFRKYVIQGSKILLYEKRAMPGIAIIFAFAWHKAHQVPDDDIAHFVGLFRKHQEELCNALQGHEQWLLSCQALYEEHVKQRNESRGIKSDRIYTRVRNFESQGQSGNKRRSHQDTHQRKKPRSQKPPHPAAMEAAEKTEARPHVLSQGRQFQSQAHGRTPQPMEIGQGDAPVAADSYPDNLSVPEADRTYSQTAPARADKGQISNGTRRYSIGLPTDEATSSQCRFTQDQEAAYSRTDLLDNDLPMLPNNNEYAFQNVLTQEGDIDWYNFAEFLRV